MVEEQNRQQAAALQQQEAALQQQAAALQQQDAELHLLRTGDRPPSPEGAAADSERRIADLERLVHQLQHPPPPQVPPQASSTKNKSVEPGKELRANPEFLQMAIGAGSTALDVSRLVLKMFSLWGSAGSTLRQLLLWALQLPASETSLVPAGVTGAVRTFCADQLGFSLDSAGGGIAGDGDADCFGRGADSARRRGVFQALLVFLQQDGPLKDMDAELLIAFTSRLQPSLRLSEATLAVPTFAALLAQVLLALEHGPSSILTSVVDASFSHVPYPEQSTANNMLRALREDLAARLALQEQLSKTPFLLAAALSTCAVPAAPGAAGVILSNAVSEVMGLAADSATTAAQLLAVLDHASRASGHAGTVLSPWTPAPPSLFSRLLKLRSPSTAADSPASSASPAAASFSPTKPAPAQSKSAASKAAARPAAAKSQQPGGGAQQPCPHGADCATHGALYNHCKLQHTDEAHRAIQERLRQQNLPFFNHRSRSALLQQLAAQGRAPGGGGGHGGGQPKASPSPSAAAAAAPAPQPVPQPVPQPAPPPAGAPSQPVFSTALASASAERMAALNQFLSSMGAPGFPGFAALGVPGVEAPPSMASIPAPVAPIALAASAPAHAADSPDVPIWGGSGTCCVIVDSGSKEAHGPNTANAPTRRVLPEHYVTSTGAVGVADREFSAAVYLKDAKGRFYKVTVGDVRDQPGLVLPSAAGASAVPVLLVDVGKIARQGGEFHVEGQWASDSPSEPATVVGWVRLRVHAGCDARVEPHGYLSAKIACDFRRGVMELPTFALPAGVEPVPVLLGRPSPALSASS
jgi:hypothetical protein